MVRYQDGDDQAFALLYSRWSERVYGFLSKKLSNRSLQDETHQAIFLKIHQSRRHYDPKFPFSPWLFTVCQSVLFDQFRKKSIATEVYDDEKHDKILEQEAPSDFESVTAGLPEIQREVLEMRFKEDLTFDEMARRIDKSPVNVRKILSRALSSLRNREEK